MADGSGVIVDDSSLRAGFARLRNILPQASQDSMAVVCDKVLVDSIQNIPKVPLKNSFLRGSGSVWVNLKNTSNSKFGVVSSQAAAMRAQMPGVAPLPTVVAKILVKNAATAREPEEHAEQPAVDDLL